MGKGVGNTAVFEKYDEGIWISMCAMLTANYECRTDFIVQYLKARILKDRYLDPGRTASLAARDQEKIGQGINGVRRWVTFLKSNVGK